MSRQMATANKNMADRYYCLKSIRIYKMKLNEINKVNKENV